MGHRAHLVWRTLFDQNNNFTNRRPPASYRHAEEDCKKEKSYLISSSSVSNVQLAQKGFQLVANQTPYQIGKIRPIRNPSKLQYDLNTISTWINVTILNSTHAIDGIEIVPLVETPFSNTADEPMLPDSIVSSIEYSH